MCLALSVVEACARDYCPCLVWGSGEPELNPEDRKKEEEGHTEQRAWNGQPPGRGRDLCGSAGCSLTRSGGRMLGGERSSQSRRGCGGSRVEARS